MFGLKFDLQTITILPIAIMLDLTTIILAIFLLDDAGVCEIIGLLFIDFPLFILGTGSIGGKAAMQNKIVKTLRGPVGGLSTLFVELIPYIDILPLWTIYAYICLADLSELPIIGKLVNPSKGQSIRSYPVSVNEDSTTLDLGNGEWITATPIANSEYDSEEEEEQEEEIEA